MRHNPGDVPTRSQVRMLDGGTHSPESRSPSFPIIWHLRPAGSRKQTIVPTNSPATFRASCLLRRPPAGLGGHTRDRPGTGGRGKGRRSVSCRHSGPKAGLRRRDARSRPRGRHSAPEASIIFVPFGHYDEPEILRYAITSICPKGTDVRHTRPSNITEGYAAE